MKLQKNIFKIFILSLAITILAPIVVNAISSITNEEEITLAIDEFRGQDSDGTYTAYGFAGGQYIYKIYENKNGTSDYNKAIYCLDVSRGFNNNGKLDFINTYTYNLKKDMLSEDGKNYIVEEDYEKYNKESFLIEDYDKVVKILKNIYIPGSGEDARKNFLKKMNTENLQYVDEHNEEQIYITDKDIEVAQQLAIWHYTNENTITNGRKLSEYLGTNNLTDIYQAIYSDAEKTQVDRIIMDVNLEGLGPDEGLKNTNLGRRRL